MTRWDPTSELTRGTLRWCFDLGLEKSPPVATLVAKPLMLEELLLLAGAKPLNAEDIMLYRSVTMRVSNDARSFAADSLARGRKKTSTVSNVLDATCMEQSRFEPQTLLGVLEMFCDADHVGDLGARKSRSGIAVMWRSHLIKHGSAVTTAWSSGESEHNGLLRSSAHALGIKAMPNEWHYGVKCEIHMRCDGSAARGMSVRQGLEKTRHVDVCFLWLQQAVQEGTFGRAQCPDKRELVRHIHEDPIPSRCRSLLWVHELPHGKRWKLSSPKNCKTHEFQDCGVHHEFE